MSILAFYVLFMWIVCLFLASYQASKLTMFTFPEAVAIHTPFMILGFCFWILLLEWVLFTAIWITLNNVYAVYKLWPRPTPTPPMATPTDKAKSYIMHHPV